MRTYHDNDYDEEKYQQSWEFKEHMSEVRGLRNSLGDKVPQRFTDNLEDLYNWLNVNSNL